jgi:hypothetical protein
MFLVAAEPMRVATGSMIGVADRMRRPQGAVDAVAASWTMGSEEDCCVRYGIA